MARGSSLSPPKSFATGTSLFEILEVSERGIKREEEDGHKQLDCIMIRASFSLLYLDCLVEIISGQLGW